MVPNSIVSYWWSSLLPWKCTTSVQFFSYLFIYRCLLKVWKLQSQLRRRTISRTRPCFTTHTTPTTQSIHKTQKGWTLWRLEVIKALQDIIGLSVFYPDLIFSWLTLWVMVKTLYEGFIKINRNRDTAELDLLPYKYKWHHASSYHHTKHLVGLTVYPLFFWASLENFHIYSDHYAKPETIPVKYLQVLQVTERECNHILPTDMPLSTETRVRADLSHAAHTL